MRYTGDLALVDLILLITGLQHQDYVFFWVTKLIKVSQYFI